MTPHPTGLVVPRHAPRALLATGLATLLLALPGGLRAAPRSGDDGSGADTYAGGETELLPVDVVVRVVNGTTREDGRAESVTLIETGPARQVIATARDVAGKTVFSRLFLDETRSYVVQAVSGGTPYFTATTGHDVAAGPVTVYVFETTTDRAGVRVSELTLNVKREEAELRLEYVIAILNETQPQRTVLPDPTSFELQLPEGAVGAAFEVLTGGVPQKVAAVAGQGAGRSGLAVPLRSGTTRLRVTTTLPCRGRAHFALAANLPVTKFTLLASPPDLKVDGGLSDAGLDQATGCERWDGPVLAANQVLLWTMAGGTAPRVAERREGPLAGAAKEGLARVKQTGRDLGPVGAVALLLALVALLIVGRARRAREGHK